jgi:hypothetical protein
MAKPSDMMVNNPIMRCAVSEIDWTARTKNLLKAELKRKGVSYADLARRLGAIGVIDSERNIANKIARGSFTAVFFLQCLTAIDAKKLDLEA